MKLKEALLAQLYVFFIILCSCKQDLTKANEKLILGEWQPVAEEEGYEYNLQCYNFMEDGMCDYYPGFFSYYNEKAMLLYDRNMYCKGQEEMSPDFVWRGTELNNVKRFYGNRSTYKIAGDTLKIFDPSKSVWNEQQILFLSADSMVLSYINECQREIHVSFGRLSSSEIPESPPIDRLIFYYPENFTSKIFSIQRNGIFVSSGYTTENALCFGMIGKEVFEHIEKQFKRVDFSKIEPFGSHSYQYSEPKIAVIRGNDMKIIPAMSVNTIYKEFYRAYIPAQFIQDITWIRPIALREFKKNNFYSEMFSFCNFILRELNEYSWEIETFYLKQLLMTAENTDCEFEPKYRFQNNEIKIETDGRYFRFTEVINVSTTLDIGINFIEDINRIFVDTGYVHS